MKLIYCLLLLLCPYMSRAQQQLESYGINSIVPDMAFNNIVNSSHSSTSLAKLAAQKKLTVLNFMATTCLGCIKALPLMDSLQEQFKGQVQLLLITPENKERVGGFLKKKAGFKLAFVTKGQELKPFFPHEYISHLVWINENRKVIAITGADYFTASNIKAALQGNTKTWPVKDDTRSNELAADDAIPLFDEQETNINAVLWPSNPALPTSLSFVVDTAANSSTLTLANKPLLFFCRQAMQAQHIPLSHILFKGIDAGTFSFNPAIHLRAAWQQAFFFTYRSVASPAMDGATQMSDMLGRMHHYFGFDVRQVDTTINVIALQEINQSQVSPNSPALKSVPGIESILWNLNNQLSMLPVIDERKNRQNLRLPFSHPLPNDPLLLNDFLCSYNLVFKPAKTKVPVLLISNTGHSQFLQPAKTYLK